MDTRTKTTVKRINNTLDLLLSDKGEKVISLVKIMIILDKLQTTEIFKKGK